METTKHIAPSVEEHANVLTHALAILLCVPAIIFLQNTGIENGASPLEMTGLRIFSYSMLVVYCSSTIYHLSRRPAIRFKLQILDHITIYFLIAGTHTPYLLYYLNNPTGYFYLGILWGMVALGIIYKLFFFGKLKLLSVLFYLGMGWMAIFTLPPMLDQLAPGVLYWTLVGGVLYTTGVVFFLWEKLPFHHMIWHLLVMGGSGSHFVAVYCIATGG